MPLQHIQLTARELLTRELADGREIDLEVATDSMSPCLVPGDRVTVAPVAAAGPLRCGDLVLLAAGPDWIVHRYLGPFNDSGVRQVLTRGDRAHRCDAPIQHNAVVGKVTGVQRNGRRFALRTGPPQRFLASLHWLGFRLRRMSAQLRRAQPARSRAE